jgi:hypothetical protein
MVPQVARPARVSCSRCELTARAPFTVSARARGVGGVLLQ